MKRRLPFSMSGIIPSTFLFIDMKKSLATFVILSFTISLLSGCASVSSKFEKKADMGMFGGSLSGVVIGGLVGNIPGALLGGMIGLAAGDFVGDYYDKKLATREEALTKYKLKRNEEKLVLEGSTIDPRNASVGASVKMTVKYTIVAPSDIKEIQITETRMILSEKGSLIRLDERQVRRTQGTHRSTFKFKVPVEISKGESFLITVISDEKQAQTVKSPLKIV